MIGVEVILARLVLAAVLGAIVGLEREARNRAPGLRTHAMVAMASALLMIVSAFGFADVLGHSAVTLDPSRVAAQVVSGIGFLGAGAIFFQRNKARGLTTAASIWTVAAVGLATGGGLYLAALATTILALGILAVLKPLERYLFSGGRSARVTLIVDRRDVSVRAVESAVEGAGVSVERLSIRPTRSSARDRMHLVIAPTQRDVLHAAVDALRDMPGVRAIRLHETPKKA
jgi:putative Mg2+ transporter-C (MgtC) family protein